MGMQRIEWKSNQPIVGIELTNWELYETHYGNTTDRIEIKLNPLWEYN